MGFKDFFESKKDYFEEDEPEMDFIDSYDDTSSEVYQMPVSEAGDISRIVTIHPESYNADAKKVGEAFRENIPVILNLSFLNSDEAKRMVDFSSGLIFGLRGSIEKITNKVFLLSPAYIEVSKIEDEEIN